MRVLTSFVLWALLVQNPRLATAFATVQVVHPGHPTAVGGLPLSKPGLCAETHDL